MRNLIYFIAICLIFSCGIFRKKSKDKLIASSQSTIQTDIKTSEVTTDRSKITIKERADTTITTPAKQTSGQVKVGLNMDSLVNGLTAISNDLVDVKLVLDSNGILTTTALVKPQQVKFHFDRETIINKDVTSEKKVDEKRKETAKQSTKQVTTKNDPTSIGLWTWLGIAAIAGITLYFIIKK